MCGIAGYIGNKENIPNKKKHSESKFLFSVLNIILISNIIHKKIH